MKHVLHKKKENFVRNIVKEVDLYVYMTWLNACDQIDNIQIG